MNSRFSWAGSGYARLAGALDATIPIRAAAGRSLSRASNAVRPHLRSIAMVVGAALTIVLSVLSGSVEGTDRQLVFMGFDPDRAQLITALIIGGAAAAVAALISSRPLVTSILGAVGVIALYAQTFGRETQNAWVATGPDGAFDAVGWVLTILTLVVTAGICGWIGATLAIAARPGLISTGRSSGRTFRWIGALGLAALATAGATAARAVRRPSLRERLTARAAALRTSALPRPDGRSIRQPVAALIVLVLLAVCVPVFSDMVNLSPDALMLNGAPRQPLAPQNPAGLASAELPTPTPSPTATPSPTLAPTDVPGASESPSPTPIPTAHASPGTKPWLAWKPSGVGTVNVIQMPAPWIGGKSTVSEISVYTPAGYESTGDRTYPVVYEAPTGLPLWGKGTGVIQALDTMIANGDLPASIVVFIDSTNAPNTDTECADSFDGVQWFETYISRTVPEYIDAHYKTIRDPKARAVMGMSAGGFCAPMLALRHADVFGTAISFSGYYWTGASGPNARYPFGSMANLNSHSPVLIAADIPAMDRKYMYFIVVAHMAQDFYGPAAAQFEKILGEQGYKYLAVDSVYTHGWTEVRYETPGALKAWAAQMVIWGIW